MGGLFRAPKPQAPQPAPQPAQPAPQPAPTAANPEDEERARRIAALEARRLGRAGTVATSWRGVLADALPPVGRKSLLGE
ncbi:MAG: hypothetical protein NZ523_06165 [Elioraea sp.]|nr:hypothetical protein [Elioraea sp.]MDW8445365.1 hypothetical protein [Acetobacteraceae bacterium]